MTIAFVAQTEKPADYVVTPTDWNRLIINANALAFRAQGSLTRGAGNLTAGTSWKDLFSAPASFTLDPLVSLKAVLLLTVNFEAANINMWHRMEFRIRVQSDSGPDIGYVGYIDTRHATMTGSPLSLYHALTMQMATLVTLPVNGPNDIRAQYRGLSSDANTAPILGAQLVGMEI
jgi:hypothetical protein